MVKNQCIDESAMKKILLLKFGIILFLAACGKNTKVDDEIQYEEPPNGTYTAILFPINEKVAPNVTGKVRVLKLGDQFEVAIKLSKGVAGTHPQYLQTGIECPIMNADANRDGYVDYNEARNSIGSRLVPFDDDLSSQISGNHLFPIGNYSYRKSTAYSLLLSDLKQPNEVEGSSMVKLDGSELPIDGKVVVIYGRPKSLPTALANSDIPIACGVLAKTSSYPDDNYWEEERDDSVRRPKPPRRPPPEPPPPEPPPRPPEPDSWWERMYDRWNRWRERWRDWWN